VVQLCLYLVLFFLLCFALLVALGCVCFFVARFLVAAAVVESALPPFTAAGAVVDADVAVAAAAAACFVVAFSAPRFGPC